MASRNCCPGIGLAPDGAFVLAKVDLLGARIENLRRALVSHKKLLGDQIPAKKALIDLKCLRCGN
jgi:hypothetical protein